MHISSLINQPIDATDQSIGRCNTLVAATHCDEAGNARRNVNRNPRQSSAHCSNEPFEKRPAITIKDFVVHSDDDFESHLLGNGM